MSTPTVGRWQAEVPAVTARRTGRVRRRRWLAVGMAALLLIAGLVAGGRYLLVSSGLFAVEQVEVTGTGVVSVDEVRAAAAIPAGTALISVPVDDVSARVRTLPGVAGVKVVRDWPHTVLLEITERVPVAVTPTPQGRFLVDRTGLAYAPEPAPPPAALPTLIAARVSPAEPSVHSALAVLAALPESVRRELRTVEAVSRSMVTLQLTGNRHVRWGSAEDVARKAAVLAALLSQEGSVYDVTSPDLPTIRR